MSLADRKSALASQDITRNGLKIRTDQWILAKNTFLKSIVIFSEIPFHRYYALSLVTRLTQSRSTCKCSTKCTLHITVPKQLRCLNALSCYLESAIPSRNSSPIAKSLSHCTAPYLLSCMSHFFTYTHHSRLFGCMTFPRIFRLTFYQWLNPSRRLILNRLPTLFLSLASLSLLFLTPFLLPLYIKHLPILPVSLRMNCISRSLIYLFCILRTCICLKVMQHSKFSNLPFPLYKTVLFIRYSTSFVSTRTFFFTCL